MRRKRHIIGTATAAGLASLLALPAAAQVRTPVGVLFTEASVMSDYRYNGVSNSNREPSVRLSTYLWRPDKLYAGLEVGKVDFNDRRGTDVEVVAYAGRKFDVGKSHLALEAMAVLFPDQGCCGPTYSFYQLTAKARRGFGPLELGAETSWTPNASYDAGPAWRVTGDAIYRLNSWASVSGKLGAYESLRRRDRVYWDAGVTFKRGRASLDVRYTDTNLSRAQCFYTEWCEGGLVTKLTYALPSFQRQPGDRR